MDETRVRRDLDDLKDEYISVLQGFVQVPSASPPGDTRQAVKFLESYLDRQGIPFTTYSPNEDKPNIVACFEKAHMLF